MSAWAAHGHMRLPLNSLSSLPDIHLAIKWQSYHINSVAVPERINLLLNLTSEDASDPLINNHLVQILMLINGFEEAREQDPMMMSPQQSQHTAKDTGLMGAAEFQPSGCMKKKYSQTFEI